MAIEIIERAHGITRFTFNNQNYIIPSRLENTLSISMIQQWEGKRHYR
jgi:hypothetical protein